MIKLKNSKHPIGFHTENNIFFVVYNKLHDEDEILVYALLLSRESKKVKVSERDREREKERERESMKDIKTNKR